MARQVLGRRVVSGVYFRRYCLAATGLSTEAGKGSKLGRLFCQKRKDGEEGTGEMLWQPGPQDLVAYYLQGMLREGEESRSTLTSGWPWARMGHEGTEKDEFWCQPVSN